MSSLPMFPEIPVGASSRAGRGLDTGMTPAWDAPAQSPAASGKSLWRRAKARTTQALAMEPSELAMMSEKLVGRHHQLLEAVEQHLLHEVRLPTPRQAARYGLPSLSQSTSLPVIPTHFPSSYGWQPPNAFKLPGYIYHEPGERVRESLLILEEWRDSLNTAPRVKKAKPKRVKEPRPASLHSKRQQSLSGF